MADGVEVGDGGTHAHAITIIHGNRTDAGGVGAVEVGVIGVAALHGRRVEGFLHVGPGLVFTAHDGDRPVAAVEVVLDVEVGFGLAEEGEHSGVGPLLVAEGLPALEVLGQAAQVHLSVDGAGAADDLALGDVDLALLVVDDAAEVPGHRGADGFALAGVAVAHRVWEVIGVGIVLSGLEEQDRAAGVLGQAAGYHGTGGAAADHDDVVFHDLVPSWRCGMPDSTPRPDW